MSQEINQTTNKAPTFARCVTIVPEQANNIIEVMNIRNRPVSQRKVNEYAEQMRKGIWKLNGETIKVTEDNTLLDGQHRLLACIKAGVPFDTFFVTVKDNTAFDTIDIGKKRTGSDTMAVLGEKNYAVLSTTLNLLAIYDEHKRLAKGMPTPGPNAVEAVLNKHPRVRESVSFACAYRNANQRLISRTTLAFCHYILSGIDADTADKFFRQVIDGENITRGDAAWLLRNRLITEASYTHKRLLTAAYITALIFKAWNMMRSGKACGALKFLDTEDYPTPK